MQTYLISSGLYCNHGYPWCTFHISKGFFCFLFYSFLLIPHPGMKTTAWQCKKDAETSSSLLKWHFSLCFYVSYCFSVHYWLSDMLCYGIFFYLCLMYGNTVIVSVMYIVSRIKWNVGLGVIDGCLHCSGCIVESWMFDGVFKVV